MRTGRTENLAGRYRKPPPAAGDVPPIAVAGAHGARLLASDLRLAGMLLNHARYQAMERYLGVRRDQANLAMLAVALVVAESMRARGSRVIHARKVPSRANSFMATAAVRALAEGVAGPKAAETPGFPLLIAIGAIGVVARPVLRRVSVSFRQGSDRAHAAFTTRYGHLLPGSRS